MRSACFFIALGTSFLIQTLHSQTHVSLPTHVHVQKATPENEKGRFYFQTQSDALFCQIDGDQASGYNKFGYFLGVNTGYRLKNSSWNSLEMRMGIAERGSRRTPSNIDPTITPFHIKINTLDVNFGGTKRWAFSGLPNAITVYAGLKASRVIKAQETEMYMPSIDQDVRKMNYMMDLAARYPLNDRWMLQLSYIYSVKSITYAHSINGYFGRGTYHNNFALGLLYTP